MKILGEACALYLYFLQAHEIGQVAVLQGVTAVAQKSDVTQASNGEDVRERL